MTERSRPWDGTVLGDAFEAPYDAATEWARVMRATSFGSETTADKGGVVMDATGFSDYLVTTSSPNNARVQSGLGLNQGTWHESDANVDINIPTPVVSTRVDRIVLRKSWGAQTVRLTRIAGTEGAGTPALTQVFGVTWDVPLWLVSIVITTGTITYTDQRRSVGAGHAQLISPTFTGNVAIAAGNLSVSGTSQLTGNVGIGGVPQTNIALAISGAGVVVSGNQIYGVQLAPTFASTGNGDQFFVHYIGPTLNAAGHTGVVVYQSYISSVVPANWGQAGTAGYGQRIVAPTGAATDNINLWLSGTPTGGTRNMSLLADGTSAFGANVVIGSSGPPNPVYALQVSLAVVGTATNPIGLNLSGSVAAGQNGNNLYGAVIQPTFSTGAFTSLVAYGLLISPAWTNISGDNVALRVVSSTAGGTNSYGIQITAPSGAGTNNIALWAQGGGLRVTGATPTGGGGSDLTFGGSFGNIGASAGALGALPATVAGYIQINAGGNMRNIPYYNP